MIWYFYTSENLEIFLLNKRLNVKFEQNALRKEMNFNFINYQ
jgi:hypothetical protein